jgi:hypothetical protein
VFLLPSLVLGEASSGRPVLIGRLLAKVGRILFSHFAMATKSAPKFFRALPSGPGCNLPSCNSLQRLPPNLSPNLDIPHAGFRPRSRPPVSLIR